MAFPILALWLSDIFLNKIVFYGEWVLFYEDFIWVYGAFALMALIGRWVQTNKSINRFLGSSLAIYLFIDSKRYHIWLVVVSILKHYLIMGMFSCSHPLWNEFLAGTLCYGVILFGSFEVLKRKCQLYNHLNNQFYRIYVLSFLHQPKWSTMGLESLLFNSVVFSM